MSESDETEQYGREEAKQEYEEFYDSEDSIKFSIADKQFVGALVSRYGIESGMAVFDIACGTGKILDYFRHISLGRVRFTDTVTSLSRGVASLLNSPLRLYVILRKSS